MTKNAIFLSFLKKFDQYPFCVKFGRETCQIGKGDPEFTITLKRPLSINALVSNTSLALGEAYMDGSLEIEGDLYYALNHFLGQIGKFSTNKSLCRKLLAVAGATQ